MKHMGRGRTNDSDKCKRSAPTLSVNDMSRTSCNLPRNLEHAMRNRRVLISSTPEQMRIVRGTGKKLDPPASVPLSPGDLVFFRNILTEYARADWSPHQLELAALLARSMNDLAVEQMALREEGAVCKGGTGGMVPNPRARVVQMHSNSVISFRRSLALHATAGTRIEHITKRAVISKELEGDGEPGDLIARH